MLLLLLSLTPRSDYLKVEVLSSLSEQEISLEIAIPDSMWYQDTV